MKKTKRTKKLVLTLLLFSSLSNIALAQSASSQSGSQEFTAGDIYMSTPDVISIPPTFFSTTEQTIFKMMDPSINNESIIVTDLRNNGPFTVDARFSHLVSENTDLINFSNIGLSTLSSSADTSVDITPTSAPNDITAPLDYPWDFSSTPYNLYFSSIPDNAGNESAPIVIIDGQAPTNGGRIGEFKVALGLTITVPANQPPGTYSGDLVITLTT